MFLRNLSSGAFALSTLIQHVSAAPQSPVISFKLPEVVEAGGIHNIHIDYHSPHDGELSILYGDCSIQAIDSAHHVLGSTHVGSHDLAKRHSIYRDQRPTRFVWLAPEDISSNGCLHAFSGDQLLGRSQPVTIGRRNDRRSLVASDVMDAMGPWFDGVAYLKEKEPSDIFVAQTKKKTFGILGGGMSGLMTAHILDSVGIHNWQIIEASARIGGRVHTSYLNGSKPSDYQYQEMGPMRFPVSIKMDNETIQINDHKLVFQLADELNKMNGNNSDYTVNFIPWIQAAMNDPSSTTRRRPDGTVPGTAEVSQNPTAYQVNATASYSNVTAVTSAADSFEDWIDMDLNKTRLYATNVFQAHKQAVASGYLDFSESGYLRYIKGLDSNIVDQVASVSDDSPAWPYDDIYFGASEWRTIDQGLSRLPAAFGPQVLNRTRLQTAVQALEYNESTGKNEVSFRTGNPFDMEAEKQEFDYVFVATPFSKVRLWRLPEYSSLLTRAINRLNYEGSCKVALHYKTRFWEHLEKPIIGGCGSGGGIPGISSVCYPSYQINSTGPGVILASYVSGDMARSVAALTEEDHVALVQRAMIEIHGDVAREQFTGAYDRKCWAADQYQAGAWASPTAAQQDLYLPAYFKTEKHTVFIGEHTSYTHAWIFSALESAVRGTTQMLLDLGLVDEAKQVTNHWMARWISV